MVRVSSLSDASGSLVLVRRMPPKKRRRRKSAKRVARGKKLARTLPRDRKGKFLPAGSKNLFRTKRKTKRRRRRSVPAKTPKRKNQVKRAKLTRRKSLPNMSRGRRGRTKDDFPNFMSGFVAQLSLNDFVTTVINTPIPRLKTIGNKATVMELLYMDVIHSGWSFNSNAAPSGFFQMVIGAEPANILAWSSTRNVADFRWGMSFGTQTTQVTEFGAPFRYQFQTLDGFGYLLASDTFRISITSQFQTGTGRVDFKLYYRFVDIPLSEFIGIVQSTQAQS